MPPLHQNWQVYMIVLKCGYTCLKSCIDPIPTVGKATGLGFFSHIRNVPETVVTEEKNNKSTIVKEASV